MSDQFDPYYKWLGIPPKDQPPHHYRLLGIDLLEPDREVIDAAANRLMSYLQDLASGDRAEESQKLLNEIAAARLCLLNPQEKSGYDSALRQIGLGAPATPAPVYPAATPPPAFSVAAPSGSPTETPVIGPPQGHPPETELQSGAASGTHPMARRNARRRQTQAAMILLLSAMIILAVIALLLVWN